MRTTLSLLFVSVVLCGAVSGAMAAPAATRPDAKSADEAKPDSKPAKVQTTTDANRESVVGAAKAPLRDLNLIRTQVPDVLIQAHSAPLAQVADVRAHEIGVARVRRIVPDGF